MIAAKLAQCVHDIHLVTPPPPTLNEQQVERLELFDADPYDSICKLMQHDAYASVPEHYLDVEHHDYEPYLLSRHVDVQVQRVLIDLVNNCDTGSKYEQYMISLRNRFAGVEA